MCDELWDAILIYVYSDIDNIVYSLAKTFKRYTACFADFVTDMFGIGDVNTTSSSCVILDSELGDQLIALHHLLQAYAGSMKEVNALIHTTATMTRVLLQLEQRLRCLLGNPEFANNVYRMVCGMGFSERVYGTLVRAARTEGRFKSVGFELHPVKRVVRAATSLSKSPIICKTVVPRVPLALPPREKHITQAKQPRIGETLLPPALLPFLTKEDRTISILHLQPPTKRDTAHLAASVLHGQLPPIHSTA